MAKGFLRGITLALTCMLCCSAAPAAFAQVQVPGAESLDLQLGSSDTLVAQSTQDSASGSPGSSQIESMPLYRLYNIRSGEHFYTASSDERSHLISVGWFDEGVGWVSPSSSDTPVYRLYNPNAGDHHYTVSADERAFLVKAGWNDEDVGWYSVDLPASEGGNADSGDGDGAGADDESGANAQDAAEDGVSTASARVDGKQVAVAIYRQYNPNAIAGAHNFTPSEDENDAVVAAGWKGEGIAWYALEGGSPADDMWLSPAHLVGIADGIPSFGALAQGYKTALPAEKLAAVSRHLDTDVEVAFMAINARTGASLAYCADSRFYGASTIKAPYVASLCKYDAPGVEGLRDTMYDVITYSSNSGFDLLSARYGTLYELAFANEWSVSLQQAYGGTYAYLSPRELEKLWIGIRDYIISDDLHAGMFRGLFGNGYFKDGDMDDPDWGGRTHHVAGIEGDVVYTVMSRYAYGDPEIWRIKDDLVYALS